MKSLAPFKRGDTLTLTCIYKEDGEPQNIAAFEIVSQCRRANGQLVFDFEVTKDVGVVGKFTMTPDIGTETLPIDELKIDIEIRDGDLIRSTQTFLLPIVEDITR
jgi:hypothetical protein